MCVMPSVKSRNKVCTNKTCCIRSLNYNRAMTCVRVRSSSRRLTYRGFVEAIVRLSTVAVSNSVVVADDTMDYRHRRSRESGFAYLKNLTDESQTKKERFGKWEEVRRRITPFNSYLLFPCKFVCKAEVGGRGERLL
jgi:hypothetical protein